MAFLFDFGKSRTCPTDARTVKAPSRYFSIVFALDGDSTINNFILFTQYYTKIIYLTSLCIFCLY